MNRRIDVDPTEETGIVGEDRRIEYAGDSRLSRIRNIFRDATGNIMKGNIESLREDLSELKEELLDFFRSSPPEEVVDERLVKAEVKAFSATEGLKLANKKVGGLSDEVKVLKGEVQVLQSAKLCVLTGLPTKRTFLEKTSERIGALKREVHYKTVPVSSVFFDIDNFKSVNDTYGHNPGDEVISRIGEVVRNKFQRGGDVTGKFGGDEFIIFLPDCDNENAMRLLEEVRQEVEELEFTAFENGNTEKFKVTISIGVFTAEIHKLNGKYDTKDIMAVFKAGSDKQLYKSKGNGKNRVTGTAVDMETMDTLLKKEEWERKEREAKKVAKS